MGPSRIGLPSLPKRPPIGYFADEGNEAFFFLSASLFLFYQAVRWAYQRGDLDDFCVVYDEKKPPHVDPVPAYRPMV
ncbi:hypothetical protein MRX96_014286 [Rhipicephalus microplus]